MNYDVFSLIARQVQGSLFPRGLCVLWDDEPEYIKKIKQGVVLDVKTVRRVKNHRDLRPLYHRHIAGLRVATHTVK